jgi:hypothetical protein
VFSWGPASFTETSGELPGQLLPHLLCLGQDPLDGFLHRRLIAEQTRHLADGKDPFHQVSLLSGQILMDLPWGVSPSLGMFTDRSVRVAIHPGILDWGSGSSSNRKHPPQA